MITLELPVQNKIDVSDIIRIFNSCVRYSYNRFKKNNFNEKQIREIIKSKNLFLELDSWFIQCAIREAKSWFEKSDNIVFGSRKVFKLRSSLKISKEEFKIFRNYPISIQGEAPKNGNRKFNLDIIDNNQIIFKIKCKQHIKIQLPKLNKNYKKYLCKLQEYSEKCLIPYQIRLSNNKIWISFDESILKNDNQISQKENRILGIDMNPNSIGISILEFDKLNNFKIIHSEVIDIYNLSKKLDVSSNDKKQIYQNNKRNFEKFEICKHIINFCNYFHCKYITIEKLELSKNDHNKGKNFNRSVNNIWNRNQFISNIKKRCNLNNIKLFEVFPQYSSFIGSLTNQNYPDPISASIEIGRRSYLVLIQKQKEKFYPEVIKNDELPNQWKKEEVPIYSTWKELYTFVTKNSKMKYRVSYQDFKKESRKVFSLNNKKSKVYLYTFT